MATDPILTSSAITHANATERQAENSMKETSGKDMSEAHGQDDVGAGTDGSDKCILGAATDGTDASAQDGNVAEPSKDVNFEGAVRGGLEGLSDEQGALEGLSDEQGALEGFAEDQGALEGLAEDQGALEGLAEALGSISLLQEPEGMWS